MQEESGRREFLKATSAAFTTSIFTGNLKGANDRIAAGFIGMGPRGMYHLNVALKQPNLEAVAVCDVYQPHLEQAVAKTGNRAKGIRDFREMLADKSVDVVCIATPDHWHAYMTVEACKAGKDVYVEKPISLFLEEGRKMVQAARKYNRVVQAGLQQRSASHFQKAVEIVRSGRLGKVTFCRTWNYGWWPEEGMGNPPDSDPPPGLDWDLWLGPARKRAFNPNVFFTSNPKYPYGRSSYFWDYGGGMVTDWGVHLLDIVQMAFDEAAPAAITALGGKYFFKDNRETPDTALYSYEYPSFLATYESRFANSQSMFDKGYGILFHGTKGTLFIDRSGYRIIPEQKSDLEPVEEKAPQPSDMTGPHWANFLECVKTRQKPICDIEIGHRSTATCHLGNVALHSKLRVNWNSQAETTAEKEARKYLTREYRKPWKLEV